jgi:hypothetical protein
MKRSYNKLKFKATTLAKLGVAKSVPSEATLREILGRKRRIREKKMNKTEQLFSKLLEKAQKEGEILRWHFEEVSLKIAPNTRYIPDFVAVLPNGRWQVFEIKGHLEDDAAVKFKSAAAKYPEISFHMIRRSKGQWMTVYNLPSEIQITEDKIIKDQVMLDWRD